MIVPQNNNNNNRNPKTVATNTAHIPSLCYEPTSVLELRSPSPVPGKANSVIIANPVEAVVSSNEPLEWIDDQVLQHLDWDSIMKDLGLHDDSAPPFVSPNTITTTTTATEPPHTFSDLISHPHHHHTNFNNDSSFTDNNNPNFIGFDFIEDLIRAADCVESNDQGLAEAILDRLNHRFNAQQAIARSPLQRASLLFKEALQSLIFGSNRTITTATTTTMNKSWTEIVQSIKAYKAFSVISPIPMFSHFTTNQALLEALSNSSFVHLVDFDIGLGSQYASLMRELAERLASPPMIHVTAVITDELVAESSLVRDNLAQFANDLNIRFQIEFVLFRTFELLSFNSVKIVEGEKVAVLLSAAAIRRASSPAGLLADVRRITPAVVVFVDGDGSPDSGGFRRKFVTGLEFFSTVIESLDAAMVAGEWGRKIEAFVLRPRIFAVVEMAAVEGRRRTAAAAAPSYREAFHVAGFRPVQFSQFADFQAECLLGKVQVRGFHVAKNHAELVLCWQDRPMVATSVWRC